MATLDTIITNISISVSGGIATLTYTKNSKVHTEQHSASNLIAKALNSSYIYLRILNNDEDDLGPILPEANFVSPASVGDATVLIGTINGLLNPTTAVAAATAEAISVNKTQSGRTRVAEITTYLAGSHYLGEDTDLITSVIGGGAPAVSIAGGIATITVATGGHYHIRQSRNRAPYFPGFPNEFQFTFTSFDAQSGVDKEVGYFSSETGADYTTNYDGIRLYNDGTLTGYYIQVWNKGTANINSVRADWYDPLDGSGPSGINYNFANFTIIRGDFLYLGGSSVRLYIEWEGQKVLFFMYHHAGKKANTIFDSPVQPIRYGIRSSGSAGTFGMVCYSVGSEGSATFKGKGLSTNMQNTFINANTIGTRYVVKGLKLNDLKGSVILKSFTLQALTNDDFLWEILLNPTYNAGTTTSAIANSPVNEITGETSGSPSTSDITDPGTILRSGYANGNSSITLDLEDLGERLGHDIDETPDEIIISATPRSTNLDIKGTINFDVIK